MDEYPYDLRGKLEREKAERHADLRDLEDRLRDRIHDAINLTAKNEGMITEVRIALNERQTRLEEQQRQTRDDVSSIITKVDGLRETLDTKLETLRASMDAKLNSTLKSFDSDLKTFTKEVGIELTDVKVALGKIDIKTIGIISFIVVLANILAPVLFG